jgi:hypothetical protein
MGQQQSFSILLMQLERDVIRIQPPRTPQHEHAEWIIAHHTMQFLRPAFFEVFRDVHEIGPFGLSIS